METSEFIKEMFGASTSADVYICSLPNSDSRETEPGEKHIVTRAPGLIASFVAKWDRQGRGLYFCTSTVKHGATRRAKDTLAEINGLWCDIDFKVVNDTSEDVDKALAETFLPPSFVVASGNGRHAYWTHKEAIEATPETIAEVETLLRTLAEHLGGDPSVAQCAALMRAPYSHNTKNGDWKEVNVLVNSGRRYELAELGEWLTRFSAPALRRKAPSNGEDRNDPLVRAGRQAPIDVEQRLHDMRFGGAGNSAIHTTQISATAALLEHGAKPAEVVAAVLEATRGAAGEAGSKWDWAQEKRDLEQMCATWLDKHPRAIEGVINIRAPYDNARLFQTSLATPLRYHRGAFYEWNGRSWPEADEASLRARLYGYLDRCRSNTRGGLCPVKPNALMVGGVLDALRGAAYLDTSIEPPAWIDDTDRPPAREVIACANGLLHLPTLSLLPHAPSFFNLNALDYSYERDAPEPRQWLAFLHKIWPDDQHSIDALQEIFGYLLTSDTSQQKAFLIVGPKRSGKGTIGRVLTRLVGPHNCAAPTLASLGANFGLAPLIGKNLTVISDARLSGRVDQHIIAESLLAITGEDTRTIDRKYAQSWTGKLPTRFVVLTNELPKLADVSGALASRFILLLLTESFYGREDQGLTNKLLTELPGILNWAVVGWRRLARFGRFKPPPSSQQAMEQLEDLASPVGAFVRERCEIGSAYSAGVDDVFGAWETWCQAQRREHTGTVQSFARDLRAAVPGLKVERPRQNGERVRVYQGVRLNNRK
jgi:putative DNA primase/helicase